MKAASWAACSARPKAARLETPKVETRAAPRAFDSAALMVRWSAESKDDSRVVAWAD